MISAAELASLRTQDAQTFTTTATVLHKVTAEDTQGGSLDTYPTEGAATYPCSFGRLGQVRPVERESQPRIQLVADWNFVFPVEADIRPTDRIAVGTRTFEVVDAGIGSADVVRRAICLEIT
jgi:hypothetical protein